MDKTMMGNAVDIERELLSHVELCYAVALALTRNPDRAVVLVRETLRWAWQRSGRDWEGDALKMTLLRELRGRYLRHRRTVRKRTVLSGKQLVELEL